MAGQVEPGREVVVDDTEEIVQDTIRIRVLETPINTRATDMLATETSMQLSNLFRLKIIKALSAEQVCNKMSELLDSELKYMMAINQFTVKLEETEEDSQQLVQVWEHLQQVPNFKTLRKQDCELWTSVQGIKKCYFDIKK